ncbi:MAG: methyltransferase domain-containing protein [Planktomarina sp.]
MFLHEIARDELLSRREDVNRVFTDVAVVTPFPDVWANVGATVIAPNDVLDVQPEKFDLVFHALCLHQFDDPLGQIIQSKRALKPDGVFLATMFGGETLVTLRDTLTRAELSVTEGASPRVNPMIEIRDAGALLQRAGLALPVSDLDPKTVSYANLTVLMHDLRDMGETSTLVHRPKTFTRKAIFDKAAEMYPKEDGRIIAEFDMIHLNGWAPHDSQPKPLRPGSAKVSLLDALKPPSDD